MVSVWRVDWLWANHIPTATFCVQDLCQASFAEFLHSYITASTNIASPVKNVYKSLKNKFLFLAVGWGSTNVGLCPVAVLGFFSIHLTWHMRKFVFIVTLLSPFQFEIIFFSSSYAKWYIRKWHHLSDIYSKIKNFWIEEENLKCTYCQKYLLVWLHAHRNLNNIPNPNNLVKTSSTCLGRISTWFRSFCRNFLPFFQKWREVRGKKSEGRQWSFL